jgi:predicted pyridoxine 5'-phosphate oxidase superfamily flavin-nucleotide-binding protein
MESTRPGSGGEHALQERYATFKRAAAFYDKQMLDYLNPLMREYIAQQEMCFIATADAHGEADASFRAGPPGFVRVLDERTLIYPEYRGNGVMASLGNISENGHVGLLFVDFFRSAVGLHVNGTARVVENDAVSAFAPILERMAGVGNLHEQVEDKKKTPERWVFVEVVEAYIHCSKHIPSLRKLDKDIDWGTDNEQRKGGDYFKAKNDPRPWVAPVEPKAKPVPAPAPAAEPEPEPAVATLACDVPIEAEAAAPEPVAVPEPVAAAEPVPTAEVPAGTLRRPNHVIPEAVPASETTQPDVAPADDAPEFPVAPVTNPGQAEKSAFGPEIALEEKRADDDARAAAQEHDLSGDSSEDMLDLWVVPDWRPAVTTN